jgi:conjugal transfer pilus assembly protein TraW
MTFLRLFLSGFFIVASAQAKDLGTFGETWEIMEKDVIEEIHDKLTTMEANGELAKHNLEILEKTKKSVLHPKAIANIKHTEKPREYLYDPTYRYPEDLKDHMGRIFYKAGSKVNPFDHLRLPYELLFFDGADKAQVSWAVARYKQAAIKPLLIIVGGEPLTLGKTHDIHFYFDQHGSITQKLGITQVPAIVAQNGKALRIREIKIPEVLSD